MKKFFAMLLALTMVLALVACGGNNAGGNTATNDKTTTPDTTQTPDTDDKTDAEEPMKVALLLPGSANDKSWNQYGYDALMQVKSELGAEVAYSENVTNTDLQTALRDYASQGYDVIIGHTGSFEDDMIKVASEFPDTHFVVIAGSTGAGENCTAVDTAPWQYGYAYGWMAAKVTKTGKVGYITANEGTGTQNNLVGSWKDGVKTADPDVEGTVVYLSDGDDVAAAREAALAMVSAGCDVIMHELNLAAQGVMDVCKEEGIYTIGRGASDMEYNPDYQLTYCVFDWSPKYVNIVQRIAAGELPGGAEFFGFHTEPDAPGFVFTYDDANGWNPDVVTDELLAEFETAVVEKWKADPIYTYTVEQAAGGSF